MHSVITKFTQDLERLGVRSKANGNSILSVKKEVGKKGGSASF